MGRWGSFFLNVEDLSADSRRSVCVKGTGGRQGGLAGVQRVRKQLLIPASSLAFSLAGMRPGLAWPSNMVFLKLCYRSRRSQIDE